MKTIIAGGREYSDRNRLFAYLDKRHALTPITEVVCGMARGADTLGKEWAESRGVPVAKFPADWDRHGRKAGPLRNIEMAEYAEALIAVWDGQSKGTAHMIREAKARGFDVVVLRY